MIACKQELTPTLLKIAKVLPLHKKGSKEKIENYQPISILSPFNKIFEKIYIKGYPYLSNRMQYVSTDAKYRTS